jgi:hypothetical protein
MMSQNELQMQLILFDMEVYKYDWIAGFKIHNTGEYIQIHNDRHALLSFIDTYKEAMFFTINGERYDNNILKAIIDNKDPYKISQLIILHNKELKAWDLPIICYDLSKQKTFYPSLKAFESNNGMSIEELPITASYEDKLNKEQLNILMSYNRHDLDATEISMVQRMQESIMVKARLIKYFNLDFKKWITRTIVSIVVKGFGAIKGDFEHQAFSFDGIYSTLDIKNERVRQHLINETFYKEDLVIDIAGITHHIKKGGIHASKEGYYESTNVWHVDFASFYPSLMIEYDLLSRALPGEEGLNKFKKVRADRYVAKANKSLDDIALKEAINSVFGAANSEYSDLYDPSRSQLVCMYGQAFAIDLTEKLEPYVDMVQSNTDGIVFTLKDPSYEDAMRSVIQSFTERTRLKMDIEFYDKLCQKDVNNYVALHENKVVSKGGMTNLWDLKPEQSHYRGTYRLFQTTVVDRAVTFNLLFNKPCEETVKEEYDAKNWFRFQATSKIGSMYHRIALVEEHNDYFDKVERINAMIKDKEIKKILKEFNIKIKDYLDLVDQYENDNFDEDQLELLDTLDIKVILNKGTITDVQHTNRVFASNDTSVTRTLYKFKWADVKKNGVKTGEKKISKSIIANLPKNVFVYNGYMSEFDQYVHQIDLQWYIDESYRKVNFYKDAKTSLIEENE